MKQRHKHESNDPIYWTIIIVFFILAIGNFIHENISHGLMAWLNGWKISDIQNGIMTGSISAIAPASASWQSLWAFFMFPSLAIFLLVIIITFLKPEKSIMIAGVILMSLNLPSLNPTIAGSDAYNAVQALSSHGFTEGYANLLHYMLFFVILAIWGVFMYVVVESSSQDTKKRIENIYH